MSLLRIPLESQEESAARKWNQEDCLDCRLQAGGSWCHFPVALPHNDWQGVLAGAAEVSASKVSPSTFRLGPAVSVIVVKREAQLLPALHALRSSMQVILDANPVLKHAGGCSYQSPAESDRQVCAFCRIQWLQSIWNGGQIL